MKVLVFIFLALIAATLLAEWLLLNPGHIVIYHGGKEFRMTLAFGLILIAGVSIAIFTTLCLMKRLIEIPESYKRLRQWQSREKFVEAFLAYSLGDNNKAERLYLGGAKNGSSSDAHFIAAAEIAHEDGDSFRRNKIVDSAIKLRGEESLVIVKRAQWLMEEGKYDKAEAIIEKIPRAYIARPAVLKLRGELYYKKNDFNQLISLLPKLSRRKILDSKRLEELQVYAYSNYLTSSAVAGDISEIRRAWKKIPRKQKNRNQVLATYVGLLFKQKEHIEAEKLLRKRIEAKWDPHLVALYGEIQTKVPRKILERLESWELKHQNDSGLGIAKARQFMQAGMWGQARGIVSVLLEQDPSPAMYKLLADIDERLGDDMRSLSNRRAGLELATSVTVDS